MATYDVNEKFQPVFKFEYFDKDLDNKKVGYQEMMTIGANYFINKNKQRKPAVNKTSPPHSEMHPPRQKFYPRVVFLFSCVFFFFFFYFFLFSENL